MQRITASELLNARFIGEDGEVLEPDATPHILMPHPRANRTRGPCSLCIVMNDAHGGYHPTELEMATYDEADRACAAYNAQMGWTREEADRIILASMGGGEA